MFIRKKSKNPTKRYKNLRTDIICYDWETAGANPHTCQPIQIAAVAIDGRTLKLKDNGKFESMISIIPDDKVEDYGLDPVEQKALDVNKKTLEEIQKAPSLKTVWAQFCEWVNGFNYKGDRWSAPIRSGYNIMGFDDIICDRIMRGHLNKRLVLKEKLISKAGQKDLEDADMAKLYRNIKKLKEPWGFGPWNHKKGQQALFHPAHKIDLINITYAWHEANREMQSYSMDSQRDYFGMPKDGAHDAMVDVLHEAELLVRYLKLHREIFQDVDFKDRCKEGMLLK